MSNLIQLLKPLLTNKTYNKYSVYIEPLVKTNKDIYTIFNYLSKLQQRYERDISIEELSLFILVNCPEKNKDVLSLLLKELAATEDTSAVFEDIIADLSNRQRAYDVAIAALSVSEGTKDFSDLLVLAENLNATKSVSDSFKGYFVTHDIEEIYNEQEKHPGLRWRLPWLNRSLGSLRKGNFGFIFARPETGKTTFLSSEATYFAEQIQEQGGEQGPIVWFNNEQEGAQVRKRMYQSLLGMDRHQVESNLSRSRHMYETLGGKNILLYDSASISRNQVELVCKEVSPSLVIFDQIDKIQGFEGDREDLHLGAIYIWARELAKTYCPVIGVCQADASGEGKKFLTMDNVANAKTAKQAEADWILGIGADHAEANQFLRYFNIVKNKLDGDADTLPELRHGRTTVRIEPEIGRYSEV